MSRGGASEKGWGGALGKGWGRGWGQGVRFCATKSWQPYVEHCGELGCRQLRAWLKALPGAAQASRAMFALCAVTGTVLVNPTQAGC